MIHKSWEILRAVQARHAHRRKETENEREKSFRNDHRGFGNHSRRALRERALAGQRLPHTDADKNGNIDGNSHRHGNIDGNSHRHSNIDGNSHRHGNIDGNSHRHDNIDGNSHRHGNIDGNSHRHTAIATTTAAADGNADAKAAKNANQPAADGNADDRMGHIDPPATTGGGWRTIRCSTTVARRHSFAHPRERAGGMASSRLS
jgi:hypothetical protein